MHNQGYLQRHLCYVAIFQLYCLQYRSGTNSSMSTNHYTFENQVFMHAYDSRTQTPFYEWFANSILTKLSNLVSPREWEIHWGLVILSYFVFHFSRKASSSWQLLISPLQLPFKLFGYSLGNSETSTTTYNFCHLVVLKYNILESF